jgi:hypothetical protein
MKVLIIEDEAKATKQLVDIIAKIDDTIYRTCTTLV